MPKRYELRICEQCGGDYYVDPDTDERVPVDPGPEACSCGAH